MVFPNQEDRLAARDPTFHLSPKLLLMAISEHTPGLFLPISIAFEQRRVRILSTCFCSSGQVGVGEVLQLRELLGGCDAGQLPDAHEVDQQVLSRPVV